MKGAASRHKGTTRRGSARARKRPYSGLGERLLSSNRLSSATLAGILLCVTNNHLPRNSAQHSYRSKYVMGVKTVLQGLSVSANHSSNAFSNGRAAAALITEAVSISTTRSSC
jgi:hypothetical protein